MIKNKKKKYFKLKALEKCPQKSGVCTKVFTKSPKKPNSAQRKLTNIKLSNNKKIRAHIPGIGHNLSKFSSVLCRGCRVRDCPGIKYRVIRGAKKYSLKSVISRIKGRSKYGTKNFLLKHKKM